MQTVDVNILDFKMASTKQLQSNCQHLPPLTVLLRWIFLLSISHVRGLDLPCKTDDFSKTVLPCNTTTRTKKIVFHLARKCNSTAPGGVAWPQPYEEPCECDPGFELTKKSDTGMQCTKCKPGHYNSGGEVISNFSNWNGTSSKGIPGSGYKMYLYCNEFLSSTKCNPWRPGGNGEYVVSGDYKLGSELKCFEQSIMDMSRDFKREEGNFIQFDFRVDGAPCRRGVSMCMNGLKFFIDSVELLHVDKQYQWRTRRFNLTKGIHNFKWVYYRSCTRKEILDVAFVRHILLVGSATPTTKCSKCPKGRYSGGPGATECDLCQPGEYQNKTGQSKCETCKPYYFSRLGFTKCFQMPLCTKNDFYIRPDNVSNCYTDKSTGEWMRKTLVDIPKWPAPMTGSCRENKSATSDSKYGRPASKPVPCACQPGYFINTTGIKPLCSRCKTGQISSGMSTTCNNCPDGSVALPGLYFRDWPMGTISERFTVNCSRKFAWSNCRDMWQPRGSYLSTKRLPGNFDVQLAVENLVIEDKSGKISLSCSVDCRMNQNGTQLAKHAHCFLELVIYSNNSGKVQYNYNKTCINAYKPSLRNGTIVHHNIDLKVPGMYSFKATFHHEDEVGNSLLSYEARIYKLDITGSSEGSANNCTKCNNGTYMSEDRASCIECPAGTFSLSGSKTCIPCANGTFSAKNGSRKCTPCGENTYPNKHRTGCEWNNCTFRASDRLVYDLSPLSRPGGSMRQVQAHKGSRYFYPLMYYINLCTYEHDNTSCMIRSRDHVNGKLKVVKVEYLRTMSCKRWSFDSFKSYSIGEVLSFFALPSHEMNKGLTIQLDEGDRCYKKGKYVSPKTVISMRCDLHSGEGYPEPESNSTGVEFESCNYRLLWRSVYACPICQDDNIVQVRSTCKNNKQNISYTSAFPCRLRGMQNRFGDAILLSEVKPKEIFCRDPDQHLGTDQPNLNTRSKEPKKGSAIGPLIATTVIALLFVILLVILVFYFVHRNRTLRGRMFSSGKTFSQVNHEDQDELVDNME